jgi:glyoxylase-like metal-dependent hydrolase (beta-lactamase superfamily II)
MQITTISDMEGIFWPIRALFSEDDAVELARAADSFPSALSKDRMDFNLDFNSFLIRSPDFLCLIDCGIGNDKLRPDRPLWNMREGDFLSRLASSGVQPADIDVVINTHLHADHVGWNTVLKDGQWVPTFPNARYVVPRIELEFWTERHATDRSALHGAFQDSVEPIIKHGRYESVDVPSEIAPNLWLEPAPGHTPGMAIVRLSTSNGDIVFLSDVMHSPLQFVRPDISSKICADREMAVATRHLLLNDCVQKRAIVAAYHFPAPIFGRVSHSGTGYGFEPVGI